MTSKQAVDVTENAPMKECGQCKEKAEWRFKDGWGSPGVRGMVCGAMHRTTTR